MDNDNEKSNNGFWAGLFIGGLVGAGITYFLSSEDKEEARKILKEKAKDFFDNLTDFGEDLYKKGEKIEKRVEKRVSSAMDDAVEDAGEIVVDAQERAKAIPEVAQQAIENVQKAAELAVASIAKSAEGIENSNTVSKGIKKFFLKKGKKLGK